MGLTRRKDGYYIEFHVLDDGKTLTLARGVSGAKLKRWKVGVTNRTVAKQQEALIKAELLKGLKKRAGELLSFRAWAKQYLELEEVRTLRSYRDRVHIVPKLIAYFGDTPLGAIQPSAVEGYRETRRGEGVAVATVNYDHAVLRHLLGVAERRGLTPSNPAKKVRLPDPRNERDRVLTEDEWKALCAALPEHLRVPVLVAYQLGLRKGEIVGLTWDHVDLPGGFIRLKGQETKSGEGRTVPLTPEVRSALASLAKVRRLDTNRVFLYQSKPLCGIKHGFINAVRRAGIEDLHFHDLRHCAATNLRRAGVDTITAMRIVGHKSERIHRRYNSVAECDLTQAAAKLHTYISNTLITPAQKAEGKAAVSH